ncbi:MAG: SPFH domain-containing protein [Lentisphaeria bacterium]
MEEYTKTTKIIDPELDENSSAGMQAVVRILRAISICLRILIVFVFGYLMFSGVFRVDEQNEAMLFRFGALQTRVLDPERGETAILTSGRWYWAWPYPIDWVKKIPAQNSVTLSTGNFFEPWINPAKGEQSAGQKTLRPGTDGYLLTGDTNIVHAQWEVTFRIDDAKTYYLNFYDDENAETIISAKKGEEEFCGVQSTIKCLLANAVILETATWGIEDLINTTRTLPNGQAESLKDKVQMRLQKLLTKVNMGIKIQSVNLVSFNYPSETVQAFQQVNDSAEEARRAVLNAEDYRDKVVLAAQGRGYSIINEAKSYRTKVVESIKADTSYFLTVLTEYERNPETMLTALYTDTIKNVLNAVDSKYVVHAVEGGNQEVRLLLNPIPEDKNENQQQNQDMSGQPN